MSDILARLTDPSCGRFAKPQSLTYASESSLTPGTGSTIRQPRQRLHAGTRVWGALYHDSAVWTYTWLILLFILGLEGVTSRLSIPRVSSNYPMDRTAYIRPHSQNHYFIHPILIPAMLKMWLTHHENRLRHEMLFVTSIPGLRGRSNTVQNYCIYSHFSVLRRTPSLHQTPLAHPLSLCVLLCCSPFGAIILSGTNTSTRCSTLSLY